MGYSPWVTELDVAERLTLFSISASLFGGWALLRWVSVAGPGLSLVAACGVRLLCLGFSWLAAEHRLWDTWAQ